MVVSAHCFTRTQDMLNDHSTTARRIATNKCSKNQPISAQSGKHLFAVDLCLHSELMWLIVERLFLQPLFQQSLLVSLSDNSDSAPIQWSSTSSTSNARKTKRNAPHPCTLMTWVNSVPKWMAFVRLAAAICCSAQMRLCFRSSAYTLRSLFVAIVRRNSPQCHYSCYHARLATATASAEAKGQSERRLCVNMTNVWN